MHLTERWREKAGAKWLAGAIIAGMLLLLATPNPAQFLRKKKKVNKSTSADNTAEPDKLLYGRAMEDIKHGRHEVGRLNMQTLINTYPDSEYLAKAKLAIADSYYKEGGTANTTLAIQAYIDFTVFFPMLPEAGYAQLQVAMAHFREMEKPDRDRTQALEAEDAFQTFLEKYPKDPLVPKAEQCLREVQEVLAEADYRIGYFYYTTRGDKRAAASRLAALVNRYPLYSRADHALWMLGTIWEATEKKELAVPYYARIVREYPLSPLVPGAKERLKALKAPVPQPDPKAVAWMTAEKNAPRKHDPLVLKPLALVHTSPRQELNTAATSGTPTMTPPNDEGGDILTGGNQSRIGGTGTGIVTTVVPGGPAETATGAETVAAPSDGSETKPQAQQPDPAPASDPAKAATASENSAPPKMEGTTEASGATDGGAKRDGAAAAAGQTSENPEKADSQPAAADQTETPSDKKDSKKESSSKKKKGLKKIVPW